MGLPVVCLATVVWGSTVAKPLSGYLTIDSICDKLQNASGQPYDYDAVFSDHAIYFQLTDSNPSRIKQLVARSLRGYWLHAGARWRLVADKPTGMPAWFPTAWRLARESSILAGTKLPDPGSVYSLRIGEQKVIDGQLLRRWSGTNFAWKFGGGAVMNPLTNLRKSLGDRATAGVDLPEISKPIRGIDANWRGGQPQVWTKDGSDLMFTRCASLVSEIAKKLEVECAVVMPDGMDAILTDYAFLNARPKGQDVLRRLSPLIDFSLERNVLIGQVNGIDAGLRTQASRKGLIRACTAGPIFFDTPTLAELDAHQPPLASESGTTLNALNHAGALVDRDLGFPWSMRVYRSLSATDWNKIRTGAVVGDLSMAAKTALDSFVRNRDKTSEGVIKSVFGPVGSERVPRTWPVLMEESNYFGVATYVLSEIPEYNDLRTLALLIVKRNFKAEDYRYVPFRQHRRILTVGETGSGSNLKFDFWELGKVLTRQPVEYRSLPPDVLRKIERMKAEVTDDQHNP